MIEIKNEAESLIYNTEKQIKENDAKLPQDLKDRVRADLNALNEALNSNNAENSKNALEKLRNSSMDIGRTIYQQSSQQTSDQQSKDSSQDNKPDDNTQR